MIFPPFLSGVHTANRTSRDVFFIGDIAQKCSPLLLELERRMEHLVNLPQVRDGTLLRQPAAGDLAWVLGSVVGNPQHMHLYQDETSLLRDEHEPKR